MKKIVWIIIVVIIIGAVIYLFNDKNTINSNNKVVRVGSILPLTGDYAQYGNSVKNGIEIAFDSYNNSAHDVKIELIIEDDKGETKTAINSMNKLIFTDNAYLIIGAVPSGITLSLAPIAEKNKIVLLSPTSTASDVKNAGDYIFRTCVSDEYEGLTMAKYILKKMPNKSIGILYINNDYGNGLKKDFSENIEKYGGKIVLSESYNSDTRDFRLIITKFMQNKIELIYLIAQKEQTQIFTQFEEMNYKPQITGSTMVEDPELLKLNPQFTNGTLYTYRSYDPTDTNNNTSQFVKSYQNKFNKLPDFYAAAGYDAAKVAIFAISQSHYDADSIKKFLYSISNFEGVTGKISFDKNGDVIQSFSIKTILNNQFIFIK